MSWRYRDLVPIEPNASLWEFPGAEGASPDGVVAIGADLEPGTLLAAYRHGIFPMPVSEAGPMVWWSPHPRAILPLDDFRPARSVARAAKRFEVSVDTRFAEVVDACADPSRPSGWITPAMRGAYLQLHELGWAHSIEVWDHAGDLAGGLYGVSIGRFFAAESKFFRQRDASKVALMAAVDSLTREGATLFDVQWQTDHLCSLGAVEISRDEYLARLLAAVSADVDLLTVPGRLA